MMRRRLPRTGIELWTGAPGAGKSFAAMCEVVDALLVDRRPVYTNLPVRWRVLRAWLHRRGGPELANLIQPLTEEAFGAFLERFHERHRLLDDLRAKGIRGAAAVAKWDADTKPVTTGPDLNWIPTGALIVIDEAHHWFPNPALKIANRKPEPEGLLPYLTMHRHAMHRVMVLTQHDRQISTSWKSLLSQRWTVERLDHKRMAWGLTFAPLGVVALQYRMFPGEADPENDQPTKCFTVFPQWPSRRWIWRVYDSFTHAGGARALVAELDGARARALGTTGAEDAPVKPRTIRKVLRFGVRTAVRAALLGAAFGVGVAIAHRPGEVAEPAPLVEAAPVPTLRGFRSGVALLEGTADVQTASLGAVVDGYTVGLLDPARRVVVVQRDADGVLFALRPRSGPIRLGSLAEVRSVVAESLPDA